MTRKRGAAVAVATLGLLLNGALAGCSLSKDDDKRDTSSAPEPTPTPTATDEATETPSPATPTPTPTSPATATPEPAAALLGASQLPPLNASTPWTEKGTTVPGPTSFGVCQRFDALSIGGMSVVERSFAASPGDTAGQQVVEYPDAQNTVRASKVFEAWHDTCKSQIKGTNIKVGPVTSVALPKGKGWWYVASWERAGAGHFHSFGLVYNGSRMTLLKMDHGGQDHDYPPGQDPMELAVKAASAKM
jgi:hypothetical protein